MEPTDDEVQLYTFDILALDGDDLRMLPLFLRKTNLARLLARRPQGKGRGKQASQKENLPFIINTARKTRRGRSTVAKAATRGKKVKVLADIAGTSLDGFGDLGGRSARRRPGSAAPGKRSPSSVAATASDGLLPSLQPPTIWCGCPS